MVIGWDERMVTCIRLTVAVTIAIVIVRTDVSSQIQPSQAEIAQQLLSTDLKVRSQALDWAQAIRAESVTAELRAALITALDRESRVHIDRYEADQRGESLAVLEDPEFIGRISRVVAALNDPTAIPTLAMALGSGATINTALADFGEQAVPAVTARVIASDAMPDAVNHGLITLRLIVEGRRSQLSRKSLDDIRRAARTRLTTKQRFPTTTWRAIDLAMVLSDAELAKIVGSLATNAQSVAALGITSPDLIARTQKRAADRLAGIPALPRPK